MNKIEELIQQLCPDGVAFKKLGEVCDFLNGKGHEKHIVENGKYIVVNSKFVSTDGNVKKYSDEQISPIYKEDILMVMSDLPNGKALAKCFIVDKDDTYTLNQRICALSVKEKRAINPKFLYYLLNRNYQLLKYDSGADQTNLKKDDILKISIPIPPILVQQEIAHVLDSFIQLEAELEAELEARKKQYEYYRNELLNFEGKEREWKTLGEVGKVCMCKRVMKHQTKSVDDIPFYKIGTFGKVADAYISNEMYTDYKRRFSFPKVGEILISASGTIGRTVIYNGEPAYFQDSNIVWISNDESMVTNKFLFYFYKIVDWKTDGGTISRLYNDNLAKTKIPIPPPAEQERIVGILEKFDKLVNDNSEGLPAEIEARKKQYEYYRGKLLDFKNIING